MKKFNNNKISLNNNHKYKLSNKIIGMNYNKKFIKKIIKLMF